MNLENNNNKNSNSNIGNVNNINNNYKYPITSTGTLSNPLPQPPQYRYVQSGRSDKISKPAPIIVSGDIKIVELRPWIRGFDIKCILLELSK